MLSKQALQRRKGRKVLRRRGRTALCRVTRDVLETAVREGIPFVIRMADGEKYEVPARDRIIVGATRVVLMDGKDVPHFLPLPTMTGVSYLRRETDSSQSE